MPGGHEEALIHLARIHHANADLIQRTNQQGQMKSLDRDEHEQVWRQVAARGLNLFFFFSSRRRHTRLVSDWSSDVCSSDLSLGRPKTAMVAFGKQLSDTDIAAVITFERNSWGNKTGEVIQPSEIRSARK